MGAAMTPVTLDPELAAFLESGLSMHAASRNAVHVASLSRGLACRVSPDRTRLTVFLLASHSARMLADFRENGEIAVVLTLPSSHRTVQLKGRDAKVEPLQDGDARRIGLQHEGFVRDLVALGYDASLPDTLLANTTGDIVAVGFTIAAAFNQTPGPGAGNPMPR